VVHLGEDDLTGTASADSGDVAKAFRKHNQMLIRWLAQKLGDVETARDIAQGAYLRVLSYSKTQKVENAQALIFKTAANLAANEFRSRKRRRSFTAETVTGDGPNAIDLVACHDPSPEEATLSKEQVSVTLGAIRALPDQVRRAFVLSRFEGKTYREIAALLSVSESSVEKYIIAALKAVRAAVAEPETSADVIPLAERRTRRWNRNK
jgi:RNA polymerase sigma factor (sigma-70 family)